MHTIEFKGRGPLLGQYSITRGSSLPKIEWHPLSPKEDISETTDLTQGLPDDPAVLSLLCQELGLEQRRTELDDQIDEMVSGEFIPLDPFTDEWPKLNINSESRHARTRTVSSTLSVGSTPSTSNKPKVLDSGYVAAGPKSKGVRCPT